MEPASAFCVATLKPANVMTHDGVSQIIPNLHTSGGPGKSERNVGTKAGEKEVPILASILANLPPQKPQMRGVSGSVNDLQQCVPSLASGNLLLTSEGFGLQLVENTVAFCLFRTQPPQGDGYKCSDHDGDKAHEKQRVVP